MKEEVKQMKKGKPMAQNTDSKSSNDDDFVFPANPNDDADMALLSKRLYIFCWKEAKDQNHKKKEQLLSAWA